MPASKRRSPRPSKASDEYGEEEIAPLKTKQHHTQVVRRLVGRPPDLVVYRRIARKLLRILPDGSGMQFTSVQKKLVASKLNVNLKTVTRVANMLKDLASSRDVLSAGGKRASTLLQKALIDVIADWIALDLLDRKLRARRSTGQNSSSL